MKFQQIIIKIIPALLLTVLPQSAMAMAAEHAADHLDLNSHWVGFASLILFFVAYMFVMAEEFTHLR